MTKYALTNIDPSTDGNVLTSDGTDWVSETPASGGSNPLSADAVVAPSGGDYTTLGSAFAGESSGAVIFVAPGTYNETIAPATSTAYTVIGAGAEAVNINIGTLDWVWVGNYSVVKNCGFTIGTGSFKYGGTYNRFTGNKVVINGATDTTTKVYFDGARAQIMDNYFDCNSTATGGWEVLVKGSHTVLGNNYFECNNTSSLSTVGIYGTNSTCTGNVFKATGGTAVMVGAVSNYGTYTGNQFDSASGIGLKVSALGQVINSNTFQAVSSPIYVEGGKDQLTITGNRLYGNASTKVGIDMTDGVGSGYNTITGNYINMFGTSNVGIKIDGANSIENIISSNVFDACPTGIELVDSEVTDTIITSNSLGSCTTGITDNGTTTTTDNNKVP